MDINERKPEEVLEPQFVSQYKELHNDIWYRLIHINTNIIILKKIQAFPLWGHLYAPSQKFFWAMVNWNFMEACIILLYALINDKGKDAHTLLKFKNKILNEWIKSSEKAIYIQKLKSVELDKNLKGIRDKIYKRRTNNIAHRLFDETVKNKLKSADGVTLSEIRDVYNDIEKLFRACSFGTEYITTFYLEGTCGGKPVKTDIEELLDLMVKHSHWLNRPEEKSEFWPVLKKYKTNEEIIELNEWRKKFGMPEV